MLESLRQGRFGHALPATALQQNAGVQQPDAVQIGYTLIDGTVTEVLDASLGRTDALEARPNQLVAFKDGVLFDPQFNSSFGDAPGL